MQLTNEEIKKYYFGAYTFAETEDGYLQAFQYSMPQMEYFKEALDFWYDRCKASTAKTLEFSTTATEISFEYKIIWIGSLDTFELAVDGQISQIFYMKDLEKEGSLTFTLAEGSKHVTIYLPVDATVLIRNLRINAEAEVPQKNGKVLWLGDSITQGYGPLRSAHSYVSVANRLLNYDILNQGIGGYIYDKKSLVKMEGYMPEKIIVSLGTNQYRTESMVEIEEYYEQLMEVYGKDIPVLCITPIWRGDAPEKLPVLERFCEQLTEICRKYSNIKLVKGFDLVPHLSEYFLDNLHPNELGSEIYGRNLILEIQRLGF
jgi:lysophospholipase L1-like esterase